MNKGKVGGLILGGVLATMLLTGCDEVDKDLVGAVNAPQVTQVAQADEMIQKKVFGAYEHVFFRRYRTTTNTGEPTRVSGGQVEIPEGYEIFDVENWNKDSYKSAYTGGYDVWFINKEPVEATAVYNDALGYYDFSEPGRVIELEEEVTDTSTLKLTP